MSDLSPIKRIFIVFLQLLAGGFVTDAIIDRFRSLLVLIPGDRWGVGRGTCDAHQSGLGANCWSQSSGVRNLVRWEKLSRSFSDQCCPGAQRQAAAAALLPAAPGPNVHVHTADPHTKAGISSCTVSPLTGVQNEDWLRYFISFASSFM